ncbi:MAG: hypothetical protein CVV57_01520 [Tenericutes bacterium HGW-Tenericutes-2]|jgi:Ni,Fe-hydrogenase III small subunit|nr:MAG: hypothetical protein CVV57_01520 [Tenericutes bacterium HGW-Tenericutes-2]
MSKKIIVSISKDSSIVMETDGYKGESCVVEIKKILSSFVDIESFELKSDYYDNDEELNVIEEVEL